MGRIKPDFWFEDFKPPMTCQRLSLQLDASCKTLFDQELWNLYHDMVHRRTETVPIFSECLGAVDATFQRTNTPLGDLNKKVFLLKEI